MSRYSRRQDSVALAREFVERRLAPWREFEAALVVGSIGHGESRASSDVDMVLVFNELDPRICPGEFVWVPEGDCIHTIAVEAADVGGVQIDAQRITLEFLEAGDLSEGFKHDLVHSLLLFDRSGGVRAVLDRRLAYPEELRRSRVFEHRTWAEVAFRKAGVDRRGRWLSVLGWAGAADLLLGALEEVVLLLHAYSGEFAPYRYRRLLSVGKLAWVPEDFALLRDAVLTPATSDAEANVAVAYEMLERVLAQVDAQLRAVGWARDFGDVWGQRHAELGFAHTMEAWKDAHEALLRERTAATDAASGDGDARD